MHELGVVDNATAGDIADQNHVGPWKGLIFILSETESHQDGAEWRNNMT